MSTRPLIVAVVALRFGWVAQLAEQRTENPRVGGSIPPPARLRFFFEKRTFSPRKSQESENRESERKGRLRQCRLEVRCGQTRELPNNLTVSVQRVPAHLAIADASPRFARADQVSKAWRERDALFRVRTPIRKARSYNRW